MPVFYRLHGLQKLMKSALARNVRQINHVDSVLVGSTHPSQDGLRTCYTRDKLRIHSGQVREKIMMRTTHVRRDDKVYFVVVFRIQVPYQAIKIHQTLFLQRTQTLCCAEMRAHTATTELVQIPGSEF